ncbi:hypothetical protein LOD99_8875 [Oopsacas minuta]|uniref:RanBP2-type domain-containing protein n=1 Tax=Oopsacas minuta TaxID=111878 RepID=A0AAV7JEM2_9METZ|nr:hypothetical protein LOD99_8875 [Oopsacas minuta]
MTGYTDPTIKDETFRILRDLERAITDDSKRTREIVKTEFTELKRKVTEFELEKLDYINQIESEKKAQISTIRSQHDGLKMAQSFSAQNNPEITKKFSELEKDLNRLRNSMMSKQINIDINKVEVFDQLQLFCNTNYGVPPGTQTIPPPYAVPQQKLIIQETLDKVHSESRMPAEKLESIEGFIRFVLTFKSSEYKPTLTSNIPIEIANEAKRYVKVENKYTMANFYDIMLRTMKEGKSMKNICAGFENLAKMCNCVYFDSHSDETKIIKVDGPFYKQGISNNLCSTDDILRLLGYENRIQFWQFNKPQNVKKFEAQIERLFCELCILVQESIAIEKQIKKEKYNEYILQKIDTQVVPNLPTPVGMVKPVAPDPVEKPNPVEGARPVSPEDDEEQYAFSELLVAIDALGTQDQKYTTSLAEANPDEFLELAKKCINLPVQKKYQNIDMYKVIHGNVLNHKQVGEIKIGLVGVFKYALNQYVDAQLPEIQLLLYDKDPFHSLVSSKMINSEEIFLKLGYLKMSEGQGMQLKEAVDDRTTRLHNVSLICCELLIAIQELSEFGNTDQNPLKYFDTNKDQSVKSSIPEPAPRKSMPNILPPPAQGFGPIQSIPKQGSGPIQSIPKQGSGPISNIPPPLELGQMVNIPQSQSQGYGPVQNIPPKEGLEPIHPSRPQQGSGPIQFIPQPIGPGQMPNMPQSQSQGSGQIQNIDPQQQQWMSQLPQRSLQQQNAPPPQNFGPFHSFQGPHPSLNLLQGFEKLRETLSNFKLQTAIPSHLIDLARACLPLSAKDKYALGIICEIVLQNLKHNTPIVQIREGIEWLAKYCICIFLRVSDREVLTLKESGSLFFREICARIKITNNIFTHLGYEYLETDRSFYLKAELFENPANLNRLIETGCDCLLAMQDLIAYEHIGHGKFIEFFQQYTPNPTHENMPAEMPTQSRQYAEPPTENLPAKNLSFADLSGPIPPPHPTQSYSSNPPRDQSFSIPVQSQPPYSSVYDHNRPYQELPYDQSVNSQYYQQQKQQQLQKPYPRSIAGQQRWQCPHCTSFNPINISFCEVCYKTPDYRLDTESPPRTNPSTKLCPRCRQPNRMQDISCTGCGANFM